MQNLGVTMSYTVVQGLIKKLGDNHDGKVLEWCEKLRLAKLYNVSYSIPALSCDNRNSEGACRHADKLRHSSHDMCGLLRGSGYVLLQKILSF